MLIVKSTDGGASFTGTTTPVAELPSVSDERAGHLADQWWQWAALTPRHGVAVAYYDRKYGDDQQTGFMDITMRRGTGGHVRVTNRSLPPVNEFPEAGASTGTFLGDYIGLAVGPDGIAHPAWAGTRNPVFSPSAGGDVRELVDAGQGSDIYPRSLPASGSLWACSSPPACARPTAPSRWPTSAASPTCWPAWRCCRAPCW